MVKRLLSTVGIVAIVSSLAMAQGGPAGGFAGGQSSAIVRTDPGGGFMQGPGPVSRMQMMGGMGHGPMMWFHRRGMHEWWRNPQIAQRIGLSKQQAQQLEKIHQDGQLKMIDLRANLEKEQVILAPMMRVYHPDEAQVLAQVAKVSEARAALEKERVQTMLASRNVLTEEQWNKLHDWRMGPHRGFGRRGFMRSRGRGMQANPPTPPSKQ